MVYYGVFLIIRVEFLFDSIWFDRIVHIRNEDIRFLCGYPRWILFSLGGILFFRFHADHG